MSYRSEQSTLAGHLFLPQPFSAERRYPAVAVVRPATGVKEQTSGLYAERLAAKGFVALAFDPRGFGGSDGRPLVEDPFGIVEDTRHSISFLESLPFVERRNLFSAGVCMGAGYAPYEASQDPRVKAVAAITPYLTFHLDYPALLGRVLTRVVAGMTDAVEGAAAAVGLELFWYVVPPNDFVAALPFTLDIANGMRDYYPAGAPGHRPAWRNRLNFASMRALLAYNPFDAVDRLRTPLYMAYGTRGYSPAVLQRFFDEVRTPAPHKQLRVLDAQHFEMYWKPHLVEPIVEDIAAFFTRYMD